MQNIRGTLLNRVYAFGRLGQYASAPEHNHTIDLGVPERACRKLNGYDALNVDLSSHRLAVAASVAVGSIVWGRR